MVYIGIARHKGTDVEFHDLLTNYFTFTLGDAAEQEEARHQAYLFDKGLCTQNHPTVSESVRQRVADYERQNLPYRQK